MSLIQVSSNSRAEANYLQQQEGYRFSNRFNGVLEVPPYSEIALHSGQFVIDTGSGAVNFEMTGGNKGNQFPVVRLNLAPSTDTFMTDQEGTDNQYPICSTTNPFLYFVPRKKFSSIESFWNEMVEYLKLDPRPQLQTKYQEDGTQISGLSVNTLVSNSAQTPTFTYTSNICPELPTPLSSAVFKTIVLGSDALTLGETGTITKSSGTQGTAILPSIFYSQSAGIHNGGGVLSINRFYQPSLSTRNNTLNEMVVGIKRWGYKVLQKEVSLGWSQMSQSGSTSYNEAGSTTSPYNAYVGSIGEEQYKPYLTDRFLFSELGYGLSKDSVCEYAFHITGKSLGLYSTANNFTSQGWDTTLEGMCCNILKYEKGHINGSDSPSVPRCIIIATGDPLISENFGVPYSKQLDPQSDLPTWDGIDMVYTGSNQGATNNRIEITGNLVNFIINGQDVAWLPNPASEEEETQLSDYLSDAVYPLQVSGTIYKTNNAFNLLTISQANEQTEVKNLGKNYADYSKYKAKRQIIPAEIYNNNFNDITPNLFYPLIARTEPNTYDLADSEALELNPYLYIDVAEEVIVKEIASPVLYAPNIRQSVGATGYVIAPVSQDDYLTGTASYSVGSIKNPLLIGMYIRLKNLTQKTTMGSINSVDNDKLLAVVNRYDHTNEDDNMTDFPIYSFNEYDRLYVSLNNPAPLYLSALDFEIVDKFGNILSAIKNTTLVLHIRPATYRDLYGYKKKGTLISF